MNVTDELLMALADGELDSETAADLRRRIDADPALQAEYEIFAESARLLRQSAEADPVPEQLIRAIRAAGVVHSHGPNVVPLRRPSILRPARLAGAGAIAAALVLAFMAGRTLPLTEGTDFAADLATGESRENAAGDVVRVLASYQTDQGLCRMLETSGAGRLTRELVCLPAPGGDWQVALSVGIADSGGYIPASDTLSETFDSFLDQIGAGAALTPEAEKRQLGH